MEANTNNLYLGVTEHGGIIWYNPNHAYEKYEKHREHNTQKCSNKSPVFLLHDIVPSLVQELNSNNFTISLGGCDPIRGGGEPWRRGESNMAGNPT